MTSDKQTLEHRLKRTAEVMRRCGPESDIDICHIVAVDEAAREIIKLTEDNEAWRQISKDELAETFKLIEALGVEKEIESGTASMAAMLGKIKQMRDALQRIDSMPQSSVCTPAAIAAMLDDARNAATLALKESTP